MDNLSGASLLAAATFLGAGLVARLESRPHADFAVERAEFVAADLCCTHGRACFAAEPGAPGDVTLALPDAKGALELLSWSVADAGSAARSLKPVGVVPSSVFAVLRADIDVALGSFLGGALISVLSLAGLHEFAGAGSGAGATALGACCGHGPL